EVFLGNGDEKFQTGQFVSVGENTYEARVVDINKDGKLDLVTAGTNSGNVYLTLGNGDGTFRIPQAYAAMLPGPSDNLLITGLVVGDFGGLRINNSGGFVSTGLEGPDGQLDVVVSAQLRSGTGGAQVILLPSLVKFSTSA